MVTGTMYIYGTVQLSKSCLSMLAVAYQPLRARFRLAWSSWLNTECARGVPDNCRLAGTRALMRRGLPAVV
jgi:hypothetical protein